LLQEGWFLFRKKFFRSWNKFIYTLSPVQPDETKQEGSGTEEDPVRVVVVEKAPLYFLARLSCKLFPPQRLNDFSSRIAKFQRLGLRRSLGGRGRVLLWYR
jgi:hypothetical protein